MQARSQVTECVRVNVYTPCKQMRLDDIIAPGRETGRGSVKAFNAICGNKSWSLVTKQRHKHRGLLRKAEC